MIGQVVASLEGEGLPAFFRKGRGMELNFKVSGGGKSFTLSELEESITVLELKERCKEHTGMEPEVLRLLNKGKILADDSATLASLKLRDKATLFIVRGASGSGAPAAEAPKAEAKDEPAITVPCAEGRGQRRAGDH